MRPLVLLALLLPAVATADGVPTCAAVTKTLFGISLGVIQDYPRDLRKGLRREGTAQFIADVGFESVEGETDGIAFPRIMVFFDRGQFTGVVAFGRIKAEEDLGFARLVAAVAAAANSQPKLSDGKASFDCEGSIELSVRRAQWDDGPAVQIRAMDAGARKQTDAYIAEYCADPKRRRPQDACKSR
jgi:hypothetical protein